MMMMMLMMMMVMMLWHRFFVPVRLQDSPFQQLCLPSHFTRDDMSPDRAKMMPVVFKKGEHSLSFAETCDGKMRT